ncbi:hypothetical protein K5E_21530 [Enterococcus thailandicus]|uniref:hypothetical protein n=1 Tax=Enterococcus thailandicus TaxID=417368 RepID=UPI00244D855F|nr:hypothetical protein [Enterococcus thailandicus]GMC03135.1 hypothetical protein K4E_06530 [Enterococcus thailandicus]GMC10014.1 hypothetical protein K5E_21530 [Enterococcus thailandicus]
MSNKKFLSVGLAVNFLALLVFMFLEYVCINNYRFYHLIGDNNSTLLYGVLTMGAALSILLQAKKVVAIVEQSSNEEE